MPRPASPRKPPDALIAQAAEARAGGLSWDAVAAKVARSASAVRQWPHLYPKEWHAARRAAERQLVRDATAESLHTLRRQLRSDDEKAGREAARHLMQFRVALAKKSKRPAKKPDAPPDAGAAAPLADYLEGLSDAELLALLRDLVERGPDPGEPPRPDPAGAGAA